MVVPEYPRNVRTVKHYLHLKKQNVAITATS